MGRFTISMKSAGKADLEDITVASRPERQLGVWGMLTLPVALRHGYDVAILARTSRRYLMASVRNGAPVFCQMLRSAQR